MDDDTKEHAKAQSMTPVIRVATRSCTEMGLMCELIDPPSKPLVLESPYKVSIVNDRSCEGTYTGVKWEIGSRSGLLAQEGGTYEHTMVDEEETLYLYYDECGAFAKASGEHDHQQHDHHQHDHPDAPDPTTPRVTINLSKVRNI